MSPAAFRVMYEYMEASEHSSRSAPLLRYCSDCKTMMLQAQVTPALSVAPELYQTAETLTHLGHHAAEQGPPHLLGPSHVFAMDVPAERAPHESASLHFGIRGAFVAPVAERSSSGRLMLVPFHIERAALAIPQWLLHSRPGDIARKQR